MSGWFARQGEWFDWMLVQVMAGALAVATLGFGVALAEVAR